jgi:hypothetical protein
LLVLMPQLTGCYQYVPTGSQPLPRGAEVSVSLSDAGRVAMTEALGPGVRRLGGTLLEHGDTAYLVSVRTVEYLDLAITAQWAGEQVEIPRRHVTEVRERQLSRTRTWVTIGLVVAGLIASTFVAISGFGDDEGPTNPGNGDNGQT